jgi:hypothetical protein
MVVESNTYTNYPLEISFEIDYLVFGVAKVVKFYIYPSTLAILTHVG